MNKAEIESHLGRLYRDEYAQAMAELRARFPQAGGVRKPNEKYVGGFQYVPYVVPEDRREEWKDAWAYPMRLQGLISDSDRREIAARKELWYGSEKS